MIAPGALDRASLVGPLLTVVDLAEPEMVILLAVDTVLDSQKGRPVHSGLPFFVVSLSRWQIIAARNGSDAAPFADGSSVL